MHFAAVASLFAAAAVAAPVSKNMMAATNQWTLESVQRTCNEANTTCTWKFGINNGAATTPCQFDVSGKPATQTGLTKAAACGDYAVTTGWSDQFGKDQGFTTLSVVDTKSKLIVWPAYTDKQLKGGAVVSPNQSYSPAALP